MPNLPTSRAIRNISDYLFAVDPSGQAIYGYAWDHCGGRPDNIYDVYGSGQCLDSHGNPSGTFKLYAEEFVRTARAPVIRAPIFLAGPGYDIFGAAFGLVPASGHSVFKDNTPIIDFVNGNQSGYISAPVDMRYDNLRNVWSMPYNNFIARITAVAPSGFAYGPEALALKSTAPINNYYSVASGLYRYKALPYSIPDQEIDNYPQLVFNNIAEFNNDLPFFNQNDLVMVMKNPSPLGSGAYLCNERPISWASFI